MTFRRIAASVCVLFLSCPLFAAQSKKHALKQLPISDPICDVIPLPPTSIQTPPLSTAKQQQLDDALLEAAEDNKIEAVKELLAKGADPNARDEHCVTPLMISAEYPDAAMAEALITAEADVNARDAHTMQRHPTQGP